MTSWNADGCAVTSTDQTIKRTARVCNLSRILLSSSYGVQYILGQRTSHVHVEDRGQHLKSELIRDVFDEFGIDQALLWHE